MCGNLQKWHCAVEKSQDCGSQFGQKVVRCARLGQRLGIWSTRHPKRLPSCSRQRQRRRLVGRILAAGQDGADRLCQVGVGAQHAAAHDIERAACTHNRGGGGEQSTFEAVLCWIPGSTGTCVPWLPLHPHAAIVAAPQYWQQRQQTRLAPCTHMLRFPGTDSSRP